MRLCGLKKLVIDSLARGKHDEVDFALKTIRKLASIHLSKIEEISRRLSEVAAIVCDKGRQQSVKLLLDIAGEGLRSRQNIDVWLRILKDCDVEAPEARHQIVDMMNQLVQNEGEGLQDSSWVALIHLVGDIAKHS